MAMMVKLLLTLEMGYKVTGKSNKIGHSVNNDGQY
jgi:hypothetical protein